MSWSVSACGPAAKVADQIERQFEKIKCSIPDEQETVQNVRKMISQTLGSFDPEMPVSVTANGSMGYRQWADARNNRPAEGGFQTVEVKIAPIHFTDR